MNGRIILGIAGIAVLLTFAGIGIAHVINPDYFLKRSGLRRGGELLTEWNRIQFQIVGVIFAGASLYVPYRLLHHGFCPVINKSFESAERLSLYQGTASAGPMSIS